MTKKYIIIDSDDTLVTNHLHEVLIDEDKVEEAVRAYASDSFADDAIAYVGQNNITVYEVTQSFVLQPPKGNIFTWVKQ
jgi:hypothetical protein